MLLLLCCCCCFASRNLPHPSTCRKMSWIPSTACKVLKTHPDNWCIERHALATSKWLWLTLSLLCAAGFHAFIQTTFTFTYRINFLPLLHGVIPSNSTKAVEALLSLESHPWAIPSSPAWPGASSELSLIFPLSWDSTHCLAIISQVSISSVEYIFWKAGPSLNLKCSMLCTQLSTKLKFVIVNSLKGMDKLGCYLNWYSR